MKIVVEKKIVNEMYEGIDYKGFTIEYNQDSLERAIQQAKEDGVLNYTFAFNVVDNKGNNVYTTKSLKDARAWVDRKIESIRQSKLTLLDLYIHDAINLSRDARPELNRAELEDDVYQILTSDWLEDNADYRLSKLVKYFSGDEILERIRQKVR